MVMTTVFILVFDANMDNKHAIKEYQKFLKHIKGMGYQYIQNSTYLKINYKVSFFISDEVKSIEKFIPDTIKVVLMEITRKTYEKFIQINGNVLPPIIEGEVIEF